MPASWLLCSLTLHDESSNRQIAHQNRSRVQGRRYRRAALFEAFIGESDVMAPVFRYIFQPTRPEAVSEVSVVVSLIVITARYSNDAG
jgi:hypothetical protein